MSAESVSKRRKLFEPTQENDDQKVSFPDLDKLNLDKKVQTIFKEKPKMQLPPNLPAPPTPFNDHSLNYSLKPAPYFSSSTTPQNPLFEDNAHQKTVKEIKATELDKFSLGKKVLQAPPTPFNDRSLYYSLPLTPHTKMSDRLAREDLPQGSSYERVAKEIGATKYTPFGALYKECTINNQKYEEIVSLGKGSSFQCYRSDRSVDVDSLNKETPSPYRHDKNVIKVFLCFLDASTNKKRRVPEYTVLNERMQCVTTNYREAIALGVPVAEIRNIKTLKEDGCIIQEFTNLVEISWYSGRILKEGEKLLINKFSEILKKAMSNPIYDWDLKPTNFGTDTNGILKLFDFSDRPIKDKKQYFEQAISNWANGNAEAEALIRRNLN